jgi:hypothetical protein
MERGQGYCKGHQGFVDLQELTNAHGQQLTTCRACRDKRRKAGKEVLDVAKPSPEMSVHLATQENADALIEAEYKMGHAFVIVSTTVGTTTTTQRTNSIVKTTHLYCACHLPGHRDSNPDIKQENPYSLLLAQAISDDAKVHKGAKDQQGIYNRPNHNFGCKRRYKVTQLKHTNTLPFMLEVFEAHNPQCLAIARARKIPQAVHPDVVAWIRQRFYDGLNPTQIYHLIWNPSIHSDTRPPFYEENLIMPRYKPRQQHITNITSKLKARKRLDSDELSAVAKWVSKMREENMLLHYQAGACQCKVWYPKCCQCCFKI